MLDALEFPGDLDGPAIAERALAFLHTYFHFTPGETQAQEAEERKRRRPLFAFRRRSEADLLPAVRAFGHGFGEHLVKGQGGGANAEPVQRRLTDYNLAQTEAALRKYMRGYFGAPLYDQSQLESRVEFAKRDERTRAATYYATGDDTLMKSLGGLCGRPAAEMELNRRLRPTPPATAPASAASPPASATPCWLISSPPLSVPPPARWMPAASGGACTWTTNKVFTVFSQSDPGDLSVDILSGCLQLPDRPAGGGGRPRLYDCRKPYPLPHSGTSILLLLPQRIHRGDPLSGLL